MKILGPLFYSRKLSNNYPSTPPVWFSESDNVNVTNALTSLSETSGINNHLSYQVKSLLRQLCTLFSLPLPVECTDSDSNSSGCSTGKKESINVLLLLIPYTRSGYKRNGVELSLLTISEFFQ